MITKIDNNYSVFHIITSTGRQAFCNLAEIEFCKSNLDVYEGYYTIYQILNNKHKKVSKKHLLELYAANQIDPNNRTFTIDIRCKEWFDKANGNSYHAGEVIINLDMKNEVVINIPMTYGYGDKYISSAYKKLKEANILPSFKSDYEMIEYIKRNGIRVSNTIKRDCKKSELIVY